MSHHKLTFLENESSIRIPFDCDTISILLINKEGNITLSNPGTERLLGYSYDELIDKPLEMLLPATVQSQNIFQLDDFFSIQQPHPMSYCRELNALSKSGDIVPVQIMLDKIDLGPEHLLVAVIAFNSHQADANKRVSDREAWFETMADYCPVMIWMAGPECHREYFNHTWLAYRNRSLEQERGSGWMEGIHPDDVMQCLTTHHNAVDSRQPFVLAYRLKRYDGQYRWVQDVANPTYTADHSFTGFIGSCSDIHDQRVLKEELELLVRQRTTELYQALHREQELNEIKSKFMSMASHEFRTPLSIILSSASLIEEFMGAERDEKISKHLLRIKTSVHHLSNILNDFLSLDKLEQEGLAVAYERFNIVEFISEIVDSVHLLQKKGQVVQFDHLGEAFVTLDLHMLRHIVENLLTNAIKYSAEGTTILLQTYTKDGLLTINIKDQGIGIPLAEQKLMFNKFFRATNTGNIKGTGLGLTIVKRCVELMNGSISYVSKPAEGTTFTIELPQVSMP